MCITITVAASQKEGLGASTNTGAFHELGVSLDRGLRAAGASQLATSAILQLNKPQIYKTLCGLVCYGILLK